MVQTMKSVLRIGFATALLLSVCAGCIGWEEAERVYCGPRGCPDPARHRWSRSMGGPGEEAPSVLALTQTGRLVVAGAYTGASSLGGATFEERGQVDAFIGMFDRDGTHLWSRGMGGGAQDHARAVALDPSDNIFLAGDFGSATFDSGGAAPLERQGITDVVVAKLDADGAPSWVLSIGAPSSALTARGIAVHPTEGEVFLTGSFQGTVDFGSTLQSAPSEALYVLRLSPQGEVDAFLLRSQCTSGRATGDAVLSAPDGSLVVVGRYEGACSLGSWTAPPVPTGQMGIFALQLNRTGEAGWHTAFPEARAANPLTAVFDSKNDLLIAGGFEGSIDLPSGAPLRSNAEGTKDAVLLKLEGSSGTLLWGAGLGGPATEEAFAVAVGPADDVWVTGSFESSELQAGGLRTFGEGSTDIFVARFSADGAVREILGFGDHLAQAGHGIGVNAAGVIIVGQHSGASRFGGATLRADTPDLFLTQLTP